MFSSNVLLEEFVVRSLRASPLTPSLACKIFDSMISPILTYNSEVWGTFVKSDFKSWDNSPIEKAHYNSVNDI